MKSNLSNFILQEVAEREVKIYLMHSGEKTLIIEEMDEYEVSLLTREEYMGNQMRE